MRRKNNYKLFRNIIKTKNKKPEINNIQDITITFISNCPSHIQKKRKEKNNNYSLCSSYKDRT
ncbi:hypothetical protein PFAG_05213 [Plasmodium falciparum Santa Lucia]|uniref:Uncharacterized protein n=6 Tax=Plasmodium falciparum TaxID=5833 RepID=W7K8H8_PLAFO|nr:hypothetical protein PFFVO_04763 [Plasmodium falciparum Vietnam Oak-Knoll (FVO)]ETW40301.1 hypothetical protein PFNF135_05343 [Plasmodium falciparum NF135/5.C10]ETW45823.1 hypothetical protein PFMALIP_06149 [Plasmodium falciparum MaliPS096_E11]EUR47991.1 hypothetical protein PFBG_06162 [Plasmodium falciparum 7G8]EUT78638.1 hypothetical protein PFAG_05213 [Plasmodium falciparum Santa Lucia]EWC86022.1 hypothetical protein PFNF54_05126 [Plasmodium falciparum NF54]